MYVIRLKIYNFAALHYGFAWSQRLDRQFKMKWRLGVNYVKGFSWFLSVFTVFPGPEQSEKIHIDSLALEKQHIFYLAKHLKISVRYAFLKIKNAHKNLNSAPKILKKIPICRQ